MDSLKKVAVLGGGSFGTVLANLAASNGNQVSLWVRDADQALRINSEGANTSYHPELRLSNNINTLSNAIMSTISSVLQNSDNSTNNVLAEYSLFFPARR